MENVLGTCGACGGPVAAPDPAPCSNAGASCMRCGAIPETSWGPVIPMQRHQPIVEGEWVRQYERWRGQKDTF